MVFALGFHASDIYTARDEIIGYIRHYRDQKFFYFDGWDGLGAAPVLRSIAQQLGSIKAKKTPSELWFDRVIYIDCSTWKSRRQMQRTIAEELQLDLGTMAMFDKQDEEDDFNGVDYGSRDVIKSVSQVIFRNLYNTKLVMIFVNGSDDEIDVNTFGIYPDLLDLVILWTFRKRSLTIHDNYNNKIVDKLRYTHFFIYAYRPIKFRDSSKLVALLGEDAADRVAIHPCMQGIDLTVVTECCLYELFLQHSFHRATGFDWVAQAPNYWMCDGIVKGDAARGISDALQQEIHWKIDSSRVGMVFEKLMEDPEVPFFIAKDDTPLLIKRPYRWISITSENLVVLNEDTNKALLAKVSSLFVALGKYDDPQGLPDGFLKHCSNLGVLILSHCAFSFVSPPFPQCHKLRFLGLNHCTHDNSSEGENNNTDWAWLQDLWVLDLRYTEWDDILSEEKIDNMDNLRELNIEGFVCWQLAARLHGKQPYLRRLRIIKPMHKADTSTNSSSTLSVDKTELEILDLSGSRDMKNLQVSKSMARSLQMLILDGCDGLENVVMPDGLPSSLRSFSFDGYGPATRWTSSFKLPPKSYEQKHNPDADTSAVKTSKISLQGCIQLENLFIRGLPNLEKLDLSGSAIKVLDFGTMVTNVLGLKRLILLGCEHLCAIKWGSFHSLPQLELVCVDTRPWSAHGSSRPCLAEHKSFDLQLHATIADARLARSLYTLLQHAYYRNATLTEVRLARSFRTLLEEHDYYLKSTYFNIHITSSHKYGGFVQVEATREAMTEPSGQQLHVEVILYGDAFLKIGDAPMLFFPQPPTQPLDHHVEISDASRGLEGELARPDNSLAFLMRWYTESLHVHDASTSASMPARYWDRLEWCRIERCPNLDTVFPEEAALGDHNKLHTIWASHLLKARCIWRKGFGRIRHGSFGNLRHLHLRSCPRLQFVLPVWFASFPRLETLHIIHCGDLTHVFVLDNEYPQEIRVQGLPFPKLTTIHLHDLPKLQQICEVKMLAPALETIRIRGCFGLRRLPTVAAREPGAKKPTVEIEKDVWDSLDAGHHRDLFEPPVHSRYYRRSRLLRGTVLR